MQSGNVGWHWFMLSVCLCQCGSSPNQHFHLIIITLIFLSKGNGEWFWKQDCVGGSVWGSCLSMMYEKYITWDVNTHGNNEFESLQKKTRGVSSRCCVPSFKPSTVLPWRISVQTKTSPLIPCHSASWAWRHKLQIWLALRGIPMDFLVITSSITLSGEVSCGCLCKKYLWSYKWWWYIHHDIISVDANLST